MHGTTQQQEPGNPAVGHDEGKSAGQVPGYDQRRARARLALLEQEVTLAEALRNLEEAADRPAPPPGIPDPWEPSRARAERAAAEARHWISELARVVGDPENVADEHGRLPRDRRDSFLGEFAANINAEAASLNGRLPALRASLKTTRGRQERAAIREELGQGTARLAYLQALPPFYCLRHVLRVPIAYGLACYRRHVLSGERCHPQRALPVLARVEREDRGRARPDRGDDAKATQDTTPGTLLAVARGHRRRVPGGRRHRPANPRPGRAPRSPGPAGQEGLLGNLVRDSR